MLCVKNGRLSEVGNNIRKWRSLKGVKQEVLALALEISKAIDFSIPTDSELNSRLDDDDGPWKCTTPTSQCGGCIRFKQNGHVVGCNCVVSSQGYCNFETSGGPAPSSLSSWASALVGLGTLLWSIIHPN